jgi:hypothetical protein
MKAILFVQAPYDFLGQKVSVSDNPTKSTYFSLTLADSTNLFRFGFKKKKG